MNYPKKRRKSFDLERLRVLTEAMVRAMSHSYLMNKYEKRRIEFTEKEYKEMDANVIKGIFGNVEGVTDVS